MPRGRERRNKKVTAPLGERRTGERRCAKRIPIQMWVEETLGRELYFQHAANLSEGGLYLERTVPHPTGTIVTLKFTLPGDVEPIQVQGEIVNTGGEGEDLGMGVRFIELPAGAHDRIHAFIERDAKEANGPVRRRP